MSGLLDHARQQPHKPALIFGDTGFTESYGELEKRSRTIAVALQSQGIVPGDGVASLLPNCSNFFDVVWATQRSGLYLTPLNWHTDAEELLYVIENCDARALIVDASLGDLALTLKRRVEGQIEIFLVVGGELDGYQALDGSHYSADELKNPTAGSVMIYSSGTTGKPKGIRHKLPGKPIDDPAFVEATTHVMRTFGFNGSDCYLCPAPLYHAAPIRSCTAMQQLGATVVVLEKFDAETVLKVIDQYQVSVCQFVPTHFKRLLSLPQAERGRHSVSSLRRVVHAAAPCPQEIKRAMIDWWGPILLEYYAGTEGGGVMIDTEQWLKKPGSVGKPWSGLTLGIRTEEDQIVQTADVTGPIYFKNAPGGPPRFAYHKDPAKTAEAYFEDWFTLGDIGHLDTDGYLYLTDRASNLIISGGVNIYPQEVEDLLNGHAAVSDAAVIGAPDADLGEKVVAVVVANKGREVSDDLKHQLNAYLRERVASYKCPKSFDFVDQLPRTETGKLLKRKLRDRYWRYSSAAEKS